MRALVRRARAPIDKFLAVEAASGIVLLAAAAVALVWANSPVRSAYSALWHTSIVVTVGPFAFERDLHFFINDGLMTIFFFVVGLEIRREMHRGELSEVRRAALPLAAAVGGMLVPASIFFALNHGRPSENGWGVPMATDIAFAVGVLALLGKRVPAALRVLLLALAVIDDVGAIIVIAFFYSAGLSPVGFAVAAAGVAGIFALRAFGIRHSWAYVVPGVVIWAGAYTAGIHPTLAGVVLGLMTPVRPGRRTRKLFTNPTVAPVERLERALHSPVAFGIMPLFALANAGVPIGNAEFAGDSLLVFVGVGAGLVIGKPIGILGISWLLGRTGVVKIPRGVTWSQIGLVGVVGGIGFTMAIFIAQLAFAANQQNLETAKLAILIASGVAALLAYGLGRIVLPAELPPDARATASQAESSTTL